MFINLILFASIGIGLGISFSCVDSERELTGKVAIITGAARGIGYAIAKKFLEAGAETLILIDKERELGIQASEKLNTKYGENKTFFIHCHIAKDFDEVSEKIINNFGDIDILVNNAGILDENDPESMIETNVLATLKWSDKFFNIMRKDRGGKCGTIIIIASITGYSIDPFMAYYKATKYAQVGYARCLGHKFNYNKSCVRVVAICPGLTNTQMTEQQMVWDDHVDIFQRYRNASPWQDADSVGDVTVEVYQIAESGTVWDSIGGANATLSPYSQLITAEDLESLPAA